jgi:hypothetical protein
LSTFLGGLRSAVSGHFTPHLLGKLTQTLASRPEERQAIIVSVPQLRPVVQPEFRLSLVDEPTVPDNLHAQHPYYSLFHGKTKSPILSTPGFRFVEPIICMLPEFG